MCQLIPCEHAEVVTKQAVLETGWFKSHACVNLCNPFGLSWKGELQEFESIEEACQEYYKQIYNQYQGGDYYAFLDSIDYAEDSTYIWKLKHIHLDGRLHNTTTQQRSDSVHGRSAVAARELLQGFDGCRISADRLRRSEIPRIMGLAYTRLEQGSFPTDPDNGHKWCRIDRLCRHPEAAQLVIKRMYPMV